MSTSLMKKPKAKPIEPGDRFGNLTAIVRIPNSRKWHCLCDCGQSAAVLSGDLNNTQYYQRLLNYKSHLGGVSENSRDQGDQDNSLLISALQGSLDDIIQVVERCVEEGLEDGVLDVED